MKTKKSKKKATRSRGRPPILTEEKLSTILRTVGMGMTPSRAAQAAGVTRQTLHQHCKRHPDFVDKMAEADARAEMTIHMKLLKHIDKNWNAAAWVLERLWSDRYGRDKDAAVIVNNHNEAIAQAAIGPPAPVDMMQLASELQRMAEITTEVLKLNPPTNATSVDQPSTKK